VQHLILDMFAGTRVCLLVTYQLQIALHTAKLISRRLILLLLPEIPKTFFHPLPHQGM
jgi:hypothetical protein